MDINVPSLWLGGTVGNVDQQSIGNAFYETGEGNGVRVWASRRNYMNDKYWMGVGSRNGDDMFSHFLGKGDTHPGLAFEAAGNKNYSWKHRRLDARTAFEITSDNTTVKANRLEKLKGGEALLPNGVFIGDGHRNSIRAAKISMSTDTAFILHPNDGDILFNSDPSSGKPSYFQRVAGAWVGFNVIP